MINRLPTFSIVLFMLFALGLSACGNKASVQKITATELSARIQTGENLFVLDVRSPAEFSAGHIPGAVNVPVAELTDHLDKMPADKNQELVVYCHSGKRASFAEELLLAQGFSNTKDLSGHFIEWRAKQLPVE